MDKICLKCGAVLVFIETIDVEVGLGDVRVIGDIYACSKCGTTHEWDGTLRIPKEVK